MSESACGEDGRAEPVTSKASGMGVMGKWASAFSRKKISADATPLQPAEPLPPSRAGGDGDVAGATEIEVHDNHAFAAQEEDIYISGIGPLPPSMHRRLRMLLSLISTEVTVTASR